MNILFVSVRRRHIYLGYVISSECVVDEDHYCSTLTSTIHLCYGAFSVPVQKCSS